MTINKEGLGTINTTTNTLTPRTRGTRRPITSTSRRMKSRTTIRLKILRRSLNLQPTRRTTPSQRGIVRMEALPQVSPLQMRVQAAVVRDSKRSLLSNSSRRSSSSSTSNSITMLGTPTAHSMRPQVITTSQVVDSKIRNSSVVEWTPHAAKITPQ